MNTIKEITNDDMGFFNEQMDLITSDVSYEIKFPDRLRLYNIVYNLSNNDKENVKYLYQNCINKVKPPVFNENDTSTVLKVINNIFAYTFRICINNRINSF